MHKAYTIKKIIRETPKAVSITLKGRIKYNPGQFIMLWVPGIDEKPFVVSYLDQDSFGITIEEKGRFTKETAKLKINSKVGVRGPFGNGFSIKDNSIIVAGGLGMAPALQLIHKIKNSTIIQGAKSKENLLYLENENLLDIIEKNNNKIIYCTDDGSFGIHCFTSKVLNEMINKKTETVYVCGPEVMIKKVFDICEKNNIGCEVSLERMMKCGIGVCGSCVCGDQLICKDGPVFSSKQLRMMGDFGKFARLKSGRKVPLNEYFSWRSK